MAGFQLLEGVLGMVATAIFGAGAPKMYRATQELKSETIYVVVLMSA